MQPRDHERMQRFSHRFPIASIRVRFVRKPDGFIYNAGTVSLRKAMSHHFNMLMNYTYSKSIDIATTVNLPNTPENYLDPRLDRAVGDNDVRHRFTLAFLTETPKEWPLLARDFKLSFLTNLQSPRRFSINTGSTPTVIRSVF
jgi:hypothetical protein